MKKAFTLIEIMITSLLVSIVGMGSIFVLANTNNIISRSYVQLMTISSVNVMLNDLSKDVKNGIYMEMSGDGVLISYENDTPTLWINNGNFITRTKDSYTKEYFIYGSNSSDFEYSAIFQVNPDGIGKYYKLRVEVKYIQNDGRYYENKTINAEYFCRRNSILYGLN
jgi:prepilin-type N-terminal cleavage/methylation domain-containing protein